MNDRRAASPPLGRRYLGVPWLWATAHSSIAFSIYYALGIVADHGLGLTPFIFGFAGLVYVVTTMTYVEGGAMFNERGGSNTLARHAFNELVSFVAGWAILIDYVIVIALIAITVPHYLSPISEDLATGTGEVVIALAIIAGVAAVNLRGYTGRGGQKLLVGMTVADLALQAALVVVGIAVVWDPSALTAELDLFSSPDVDDIAYALVISMVALAGIEAASNLAPDLAWRKEDLKNVLRAGGVVVPFVYVGMSFVALMALPVVDGPGGPETALATTFKDAPVLGVTMAFEPQWLADTMKWAVVAIAPAVLIFAARATMLGLSRHVYVMGRNRQIPSWLAKLGKRRSTPYVAITFAALMAAALALPGDVELLAGVFAFGALLAISIAHASLIRLRFTEPDLERPYRAPLGVVVRGVEVPLSAVLGLILTTIGLIAIAVVHGAALYAGVGWMVFGLVAYFIYRRGFEGISLTDRVEVPEQALQKQVPDVELASVLVPVFGEGLDDEIVSTAGRLADSDPLPGESKPRLDLLYVIELPLTVPLDGPPPAAKLERANRALERAMEVAAEYPSVEVERSWVPARSVGEAIVEQARERGVEAIIIGGELPTRIRGGAVLGGVRGVRPAEVGPVTEYVLRHAPCRVLLTAPPELAVEPLPEPAPTAGATSESE